MMFLVLAVSECFVMKSVFIGWLAIINDKYDYYDGLQQRSSNKLNGCRGK